MPRVRELTATQTALLPTDWLTVDPVSGNPAKITASNARKFLTLGELPETHGAVGDGVANDTTAVQAALTAVAAGGVVYLSRTYLCGALTVTGTDILIRGPGKIVWTGSGNLGASPRVYIGLKLTGTCSNIQVEGLRFVGDGVAANAHAGVWTASGATVTGCGVRKCFITNVAQGISFGSDVSSTVTGCTAEGNYLRTLVGTASGSGYGIVNSGAGATRNKIIDNHIELAQRHSVYVAGGSDIEVLDNEIADHRQTVTTGAEVVALSIARCQHVLVGGNQLTNCYDGGISIASDASAGQQIEDIAITGNQFRDCRGPAAILIGTTTPASVQPVVSVSVTDNHIWTNGLDTAAIRFYHGFRVKVSDNSMFWKAPSGTVECIKIQALGEAAGTATYSGGLVFENNHIGGETGTYNPFRLEDTFVLSRIDAAFENNHVFVGTTVFAHSATITNRNIKVDTVGTDRPLGLSFAAGIGRTIDVKRDFGAKGDTRTVTDAAITSGQATLTSATAAFTAADVGKKASVLGAGAFGVALNTTISSVTNGTTAVLAANAGTTVSGAVADIGTDDTAAIFAAIAAGPTFFPAGTYMVLSTIDLPDKAHLFGVGLASTIRDCIGNQNIFSFVNNASDVTIRDLRFTGRGTLGSQNDGDGTGRGAIYSGNSGHARILVTNCRFENLGTCGFSGNNITKSSFVGNVFNNTCEHGMYISNGWQDVTVVGSQFINIGANAGVGTTCAFKIVNAQRINLIGNVITGGISDGILIESTPAGVDDISIVGGSITNTTYAGVRVQSGSGAVYVNGVMISNTNTVEADGVRDYGGTATTIVNCTFELANNSGVLIEAPASGTVVRGCRIKTASTNHYGIEVYGDNSVIEDNYIYDSSFGIRVNTGADGTIIRSNRNLATNTPFSNQGTNTVADNGGAQARTYAATVTPDPWLGETIVLGTLTGNITINTPVAPVSGLSMTLIFTQDATGGRTVTLPSAWFVNWTPTTTANHKNTITVVYDGTNWVQVAAATGLT